ncbi:MAG: ribonuclease M5 [Firmicutes bacterium]|nr:ribonuclease M5 [Bacillota bacterium]
MQLPKIEEIIVVEGRDDTAAIRQAVDAVTIETHGFGIRQETWDLIERACETKGIIVFTDPDTAGEQIRRRIMERFPRAKEAFLDQTEAAKAGDIGIENASAEAIRRALSKVRGEAGEVGEAQPETFTAADLFAWGLEGMPGAGQRRRALGKELGIGHATAKTFLQRLNRFGIARTEIEEGLARLDSRK